MATGIAFTTDNNGLIPLNVNGKGSTIVRSTDGGVHWAPVQSHEFDLLLLDVAAYSNYAAVTGTLSDQYSWNSGATFNYSLGGAAASQCVRNVGPHDTPVGFGIPNDGGTGNEGVAVSTDGGLTYTKYNAPVIKIGARYAAFPSSQNWYLVAGEWPGESPGEEAKELGLDLEAGDQLIRMTERIHVAKWSNGTARYVVRRKGINAPAVGKGAKGEYLMQIATTGNGGSSWNLNYNSSHAYYGNSIECTTTTNCCVVGEADSGPDAGSYIWCTSNGGQTWNITHNNTDPNSSLIDIAAVSATELWAVGGEFNSVGPAAAHFWHSLDGGQTWTLASQIPNMYALAIDCVQQAPACWAVTADLFQQASVASNVGNSTRFA